jgi:hypothetical protein
VLAAIREIRETGSIDKYAADGQVASVMGKLRKLQGVLRDNGGLKVALEELLPGGGKSLQVRAEGAKSAGERGPPS